MISMMYTVTSAISGWATASHDRALTKSRRAKRSPIAIALQAEKPDPAIRLVCHAQGSPGAYRVAFWIIRRQGPRRPLLPGYPGSKSRWPPFPRSCVLCIV